MQTAIVIAVVAMALVYLGRRCTRSLQGRAGCACEGGCAAADSGLDPNSCKGKIRGAC